MESSSSLDITGNLGIDIRASVNYSEKVISDLLLTINGNNFHNSHPTQTNYFLQGNRYYVWRKFYKYLEIAKKCSSQILKPRKYNQYIIAILDLVHSNLHGWLGMQLSLDYPTNTWFLLSWIFLVGWLVG